MTVLNWKNVHFNLIVGPNHLLSTAGSIKFQAYNQPPRALQENQVAGVRDEAVIEGNESDPVGQETGEPNDESVESGED